MVFIDRRKMFEERCQLQFQRKFSFHQYLTRNYWEEYRKRNTPADQFCGFLHHFSLMYKKVLPSYLQEKVMFFPKKVLPSHLQENVHIIGFPALSCYQYLTRNYWDEYRNRNTPVSSSLLFTRKKVHEGIYY